jgi:hypothetical protein
MCAAFMGIDTHAKKYSAGVAIEQINLNFGVFKLLTIGSGFGVWRNDESNPAHDNVCNPSGIFLNFELKVDSLMFGDVLQRVLKISYNIKAGADVYAQFRPSDGFKAVGVRRKDFFPAILPKF